MTEWACRVVTEKEVVVIDTTLKNPIENADKTVSPIEQRSAERKCDKKREHGR